MLLDGQATLTLPARGSELPRLYEWLEALLEETGFPLRAGQELLLCTDEIFNNIASYAYPDGEGEVSVTLTYDDAAKVLTLSFSDSGIPFDPLQHMPPDLNQPLAERKIGGLGILVVQKMMDRVEYCRENGRNQLTLTKYAAGKEKK